MSTRDEAIASSFIGKLRTARFVAANDPGFRVEIEGEAVSFFHKKKLITPQSKKVRIRDITSCDGCHVKQSSRVLL